MTLRNIRINLNDQSYGKDKIVTDILFVMTKKTNTEINNIVNEILDQFHNEEIALYTMRKDIVEKLSKDVNQSSYKKFNFTIDFGEE